jgi:cation/acetate symporter
MIYTISTTAIFIFVFFVMAVLGLSFYFARKTKSASGYYAAGGQIHWAINGIAFAGDYLSADMMGFSIRSVI